jgi:Flp pilus assembly protein TadD
LLSKTFTLSLPAALLVVTWWKNGRLERRDWLPLVPFFVLGIGLSLWTAGLERTLIEQGGPGWGAYASADRLLIAGRAVWFYLGKLLFPVDLSFVYPQWTIDADAWGQYLYPIAVIVVVAAIYAARRRLGRAPVAGLLFFIGTLLPVLGFVDYFYMMMSFVADRFLYLPSLGIIALFAGYSAVGLRRALPRARWVRPVAVAAVLVALGLGTWQRSSCYESAETLYRDVLVKHSDSWAGHYSLGSVLAAAGRPDEALPHLETAARLKTNFPSIRGYLAVVYSQLGRHDEALRLFHQALDQNPNDVEIRTNLGVALVNIGKYDDAIELYGKALEIEPGYAPALRNLTRIVLYRLDTLLAAGDAGAANEFARETRARSLSVGAHDLAAEIDRRLRTRPAPAE